MPKFFKREEKRPFTYSTITEVAKGQHTIKETVDGKEVQDYENTVLQDKQQIVISYEQANTN